MPPICGTGCGCDVATGRSAAPSRALPAARVELGGLATGADMTERSSTVVWRKDNQGSGVGIAAVRTADAGGADDAEGAEGLRAPFRAPLTRVRGSDVTAAPFCALCACSASSASAVRSSDDAGDDAAVVLSDAALW